MPTLSRGSIALSRHDRAHELHALSGLPALVTRTDELNALLTEHLLAHASS